MVSGSERRLIGREVRTQLGAGHGGFLSQRSVQSNTAQAQLVYTGSQGTPEATRKFNDILSIVRWW
jgi:hypothetical protein